MKIFENWGLKVVAVIFSISIWFYVQGKGVIETALRYSVYFTNMPEGLYLEEVNTPEIVVWVRGPKHLLNNIVKNHNKLEISLKTQKPGRLSYDITQAMFNLPSSFQILKIQPEKITIRLSPIVEKKIRVIPRYSGKKKIKIVPEYVIIKGPKHVVENLSYIDTEEITNIDHKTKLNVKLSTPSEKVILKPESVDVIFIN